MNVTLADLRARAAARGLTISGTKADLLRRLLHNDPFEMEKDLPGNFMAEGAAAGDAVDANVNVQEDNATELDDGSERRALMERELKIMEREKLLMQRELELTRRELATLQRNVTVTHGRDTRTPESQATITATASIKTIAELISEFDGSPDKFNVWEKQINLFKLSHDLSDDSAKLLIGLKLKGKAQEWLHSRAEHISMGFDELLVELGRMYNPKHSRVDLRKK